MSLVTLAQVKGHLLLPVIVNDPGDADLQLKLDTAEAAVLAYIASTPYCRDRVATWTAETDPVAPPWQVIGAILLKAGELWRFRGDDLAGATPAVTPEDLSPAIVALLRQIRDPVVA